MSFNVNQYNLIDDTMIRFIFCSIFILLVARLAEHKWHIVKTNDRGANKAIPYSATEDPDPTAEEDIAIGSGSSVAL